MSLLDTRRYEFCLNVVQHPQRARMCGFGDKDRRPITPPPCVRLQILDRATGQEIDVANLDISFYVLSVDLLEDEASSRHNSVSRPVAGEVQSEGHSQPPSRFRHEGDTAIDANEEMNYEGSWVRSDLTHTTLLANHDHRQAMEQPGLEDVRLPPISALASHLPPDLRSIVQDVHRPPNAPRPAPGSFTRNLVGSLVTSAYKLKDTNEELGIWFVLQDLSVRTEGTFRLKFSFFNLSSSAQSLMTSGSTPILCSTFSQPFDVYSAKRFPGMIESTEISRKFSLQGLKIPVRKVDN